MYIYIYVYIYVWFIHSINDYVSKEHIYIYNCMHVEVAYKY